MEKRCNVHGAGVALVAIGLGLAAALVPNVLAQIPLVKADTSLCPPQPTTGGTYDLVIKFDGVIAFVPRHPKDTTQTAENPDGAYDDVVALIPRTDDENKFNQGYPASFYVPHERYVLHHPVVRIRAKHVAGEVRSVCKAPVGTPCDDRYVYFSLAAEDPLDPQWTHEYEEAHSGNAPLFARYDIALETCAAPQGVTLRDFEQVPLLLDGAPSAVAPASPCENCLPSDTAPGGGVPPSRLAARMTLAHGEEIMAHDVIKNAQGNEVDFAFHSRHGYSVVEGVRPGLVDCPRKTPACGRTCLGSCQQFKVARHVMAIRRGLSVNAALTLTLTPFTPDKKVHRYLLQPPPAGSTLEVDVLNLPAEGLYNLPTENTGPALQHFNLFYLLSSPSSSKREPFYFPAVRENQGQDGRPWCSNARFASQ